MSDDTPGPDVPEPVEEINTVPFQYFSEDGWEYTPFMVQVDVPVSKTKVIPFWCQVQNLDDLLAVQASNSAHYGKKFNVIMAQDGFQLAPKGVVVQTIHKGVGAGLTLDVDWFKASLYAAKREEYNDYLPEVPLNAKTCNDINGVLRSNDGCHPDSEFSFQYYS